MKMLWFIFYLQFSHILEETEGINVSINGFIDVEPRWLFVERDKKDGGVTGQHHKDARKHGKMLVNPENKAISHNLLNQSGIASTEKTTEKDINKKDERNDKFTDQYPNEVRKLSKNTLIPGNKAKHYNLQKQEDQSEIFSSEVGTEKDINKKDERNPSQHPKKVLKRPKKIVIPKNKPTHNNLKKQTLEPEIISTKETTGKYINISNSNSSLTEAAKKVINQYDSKVDIVQRAHTSRDRSESKSDEKPESVESSKDKSNDSTEEAEEKTEDEYKSSQKQDRDINESDKETSKSGEQSSEDSSIERGHHKSTESAPKDENTEVSSEKKALRSKNKSHHELFDNYEKKPHGLRKKKSKEQNITNGTKTTTTVSTTSTTESLKSIDEYFNKVERMSATTKKDEDYDDDPSKLSKLDQIFKNNSGLYDSPHAVKDDRNIKDFTAHIYKEALTTLRDIKNMFQTKKMKDKTDEMTQEYKDKFADFVNETLQQRIKTRIGTQKVILNMIEVSNRMLRTIMNSLKAEVDTERGKGHLREYKSITNDKLDEKVDTKADLEYLHACQNLGICRSSNGYSHFLATIIAEALKNNDKKLRQANDAITETLRYADVSDIVDEDMKKKYINKIKSIETLNTVELRSTYQALRNMLASSNRPMTVYTRDKKIVKRSLALRDLIDILDQRIPPTDENKAQWDDISLLMKEWTLGQDENIQEIAQKIIKQMFSKSVTRTDGGILYSLQEKLDVLLKS